MLLVKKNCLALQILFLISYCRFTRSHLNLYISKEKLQSDLNLDFGNDIYIVTDGVPAPLLANPTAFKELIAPLTNSINQLEFRWRSFPVGSDKNIKYSLQLSSSDVEIMKHPTASVKTSAYVPWYDHKDSGFKINFPCTGRKEGVAELSFRLNYTSVGTGRTREVNIVVKRHCLKMKLNETSSSVKTGAVKQKETLTSHNLAIGLSASIALLVTCILCFLIYLYMQKRNRKLHMKFDYDYELKMKERALEEQQRAAHAEKDILLEHHEKENEEEMLHRELDMSTSKPIFIPKRSCDHHRKWKKNRRRRHLNSLIENGTPPAYSVNPNDIRYLRGLEQIPEEEAESTADSCSESYSETDEDISILENSHTYRNNNKICISKGGGSCSTSSLNSINTTSSGYATNDNSTLRDMDNKCFIKYSSVNNQCERHFVNNFKDNKGYQSPCRNINRRKTNHVRTASIIENHSLLSTHQLLDERPPVMSEDIEMLYKYMNSKWKKQFHNCLLVNSQVIIDSHPLGKGAFGRVHRGKAKGLKDEPTKMTSVVVKIIIPTTDFDTISSFISEAAVMKQFEHKNILNLLGVVLQPLSPPLIVTPYMKHADLNQFLRSARATPRRHQTLSSRQLINFGLQIASGMEYLAMKGYVHRDLASRNCMVSETLTIKIADFGLARDISKEHYRMARKTLLPIKWMAIEGLTDYIFSEKSDVWSFGIVLWEILTLGKQPYSGLANQDMEEYLSQGKRLQKPPNCPDEIYDIMSSCWMECADDRPCFSKIFQLLLAYENIYKKYKLEYTLPSSD